MKNLANDGFGLAYKIEGQDIHDIECYEGGQKSENELLRDELYNAMLDDYSQARAACGEGREEG